MIDIQTILIGLLFCLPLLMGWTLDRLLGDPNGPHPIIFFGRLIGWGEKTLNHGEYRRLRGMIYNSLLIVGIFLLAYYYCAPVDSWFYRLFSEQCTLENCQISPSFPLPICPYIALRLIIMGLILFYMLSGTTLIREVQAVFEAVERSIEEGRVQVGRIVGRDTQNLSAQEVRTAALETLSENLSDGVIAPLFWYLLLGIPGIVAYKMTNTQDSMIGYKNDRYRAYGYFSAKFDDILNYVPARLTALLMLIVAGRISLLPQVWRNGSKHLSPNAGYPEAALAMILDCQFGGPHDYFGKVVDKPFIGEHARPITLDDLRIAIRINRRAEYLMVLLTLLCRLSLLYFLTH